MAIESASKPSALPKRWLMLKLLYRDGCDVCVNTDQVSYIHPYEHAPDGAPCCLVHFSSKDFAVAVYGTVADVCRALLEAES